MLNPSPKLPCLLVGTRGAMVAWSAVAVRLVKTSRLISHAAPPWAELVGQNLQRRICRAELVGQSL